MSQDGNGADNARVDAGLAGSSENPIGCTTPPSSIHDDASSRESSSSVEDEGELSEARRSEKITAKIEKKVAKMMKKRIKEESEMHHFFEMHQLPHNYLPLNFNWSTW